MVAQNVSVASISLRPGCCRDWCVRVRRRPRPWEAGSATQHELAVGGLVCPRLLERCPLFVRRLVSAGDDVGEVLRGAGVLDGHEGTVDVGEVALERGEVGDGRRAHRRDGFVLGLDGIQVVLFVVPASCRTSQLFYRLERLWVRWIPGLRWLVDARNIA